MCDNQVLLILYNIIQYYIILYNIIYTLGSFHWLVSCSPLLWPQGRNGLFPTIYLFQIENFRPWGAETGNESSFGKIGCTLSKTESTLVLSETDLIFSETDLILFWDHFFSFFIFSDTDLVFYKTDLGPKTRARNGNKRLNGTPIYQGSFM